jgi:outer membrane protein assembly factor BamB
MRPRPWCAVVLGLAMLSSAAAETAATAAWSRFRGPDGAGVAEGAKVPVSWSEADVAWKADLPGHGHSSPVSWGDRVFLTCADKSSAKRIILCLKAADGGVLWKREYDSQPHAMNKMNSYAAATPAVDAERVYVTWTTPAQVVLLALGHDGKEAWRRDDLGAFQSQHGSGASPIVWEDLVILPNDTEEKEGKESFILAVEAKTGKTAWKHVRKSVKASYGTPCLFRPTAGPPQLVYAGKDHGFTALDPRTGKLIWELDKVFPLRVVSSPMVAGGLVVASCGEGGKGHSVVAVRPGSLEKPGDAAVAWTLTKSVPYVPTPVAAKGLLFLWSDGGIVQCVRPATGEVVWSERVGGEYFASPVCVDGRVYNVSKAGEVVVLAASDTFEVLARNAAGEGSYATPAVVGSRLLVRTFTRLLAVGGR